MDGGAWQAAVHGVAKSQTQLRDFPFFTFMHWRRKWQPTPVFLTGESQGQESLVGFLLWGRTELDTTEATQQQQQTENTKYRNLDTVLFSSKKNLTTHHHTHTHTQTSPEQFKVKSHTFWPFTLKYCNAFSNRDTLTYPQQLITSINLTLK